MFLVLPLAPARRDDQVSGSGGYLQREKDAGEQTPAMAFSAY